MLVRLGGSGAQGGAIAGNSPEFKFKPTHGVPASVLVPSPKIPSLSPYNSASNGFDRIYRRFSSNSSVAVSATCDVS